MVAAADNAVDGDKKVEAEAPVQDEQSEPTAAPAKAAPEAEAPDPEDDAEPTPPAPDPATCRGIAISQAALEESVLAGEWEGTDFLFYLEPAGVLNANLVCTRSYPAESVRAGILMTKAAREAKTVFFDDQLNPESYELSFPKEYGYVKSLQHYQPESREHAKYPWSKKY